MTNITITVNSLTEPDEVARMLADMIRDCRTAQYEAEIERLKDELALARNERDCK